MFKWEKKPFFNQMVDKFSSSALWTHGRSLTLTHTHSLMDLEFHRVRRCLENVVGLCSLSMEKPRTERRHIDWIKLCPCVDGDGGDRERRWCLPSTSTDPVDRTYSSSSRCYSLMCLVSILPCHRFDIYILCLVGLSLVKSIFYYTKHY